MGFMRVSEPKRFLRRGLAALGLAAAAFLGCGGAGAKPGSIPLRILQVSPEQGPTGARVEVQGMGMRKVETVTVGGREALFVAWDDFRLALWVPAGAGSGPINLIPRQGPVVSSGGPFRVRAAAPALSGFNPRSGTVHAPLVLFGSDLGGVDHVFIGDVEAPVRAVGATQIRISVPPGAVTGEVRVVTRSGQTCSAPTAFAVLDGPAPDPDVALLDPPMGPVGTRVTLTGTGLAGVATVSFGGAPAAYTLVDDSRIEAVVPGGAGSGRVELATAGRTVRSREPFVVTRASLAAPAIRAFRPGSGPAGTRVEILGSGFQGVARAQLGGQQADLYTWDDGRLVLWVPPGAASGPLTLVSQAGLGRSAKPFVVTRGAPEISGFLPAQGRPGTPVLIRGRGLDQLESVAFAGIPAAAPLSATATEVRVLVPPGAASGPIRVATRGGKAASREPFTVAPAAPSKASLQIESMYITQAVQRMGGPVPLVAGREGLLRVFLRANAENTAAPTVRVCIQNARGQSVFGGEIAAPRTGVPTALREMLLEDSWNLPVPASALQPGNTILLELLPDPVDGSVEAPVRSYPANGVPGVLDIRPVPPLRITLFPVRSGAAVGNVDRDGRTAESWLTRIRQYYPVQEVDIKVGPVFTSPVPLGTDFTSYVALRDSLEAKRLLEDSRSLRYGYGVFAMPMDGDVTGLAMDGASGSGLERSAIGWDDPGGRDRQNCFDTFAHELGHTFGRRHAPCGSAATPDLAFSYPGGSIGACGFDVASGELKPPSSYSDVMGQCYPRWVSDYTYEAVLDFRAWEAGRPAPDLRPTAGDPDATASLLVWGTIDQGRLAWRPAFTSPQPAAPPAPGDYTLECLDRRGRALMRPIPFAAKPIADLPTRRDYRSFVLLVPMTPAMRAWPFTLRVRKGGRRLPETGRFQAPGAVAAREPVARRWGEGVVHLGWDHGSWPGVVVKDPHTHAILTIATGGAIELATGVDHLECVFSVSDTAAGQRSVTRMVKVE
ncbi:MAG: IPT/TIG domain-containing protein [Holophaga sp.]|nr:IPT/TIG domain-containing protein [Holophaga sp.]